MANHAQIKILLIDDEKKTAQMFRFRLELSWGYQVTIAYSGKEGLRKFRKENFDLAITDYNLPDLNGEEVLDAVKQIQPDLPVCVFVACHDNDPVIIDRIQTKANAVISKPVDFDKLHEMINDVLDKRIKSI
ncbi:response regulator [Candidatus Margulisiibacteriota bacterium]